MIHYHGSPITPLQERLKMAGKHICVSFANPRDADWALANAQSVMWDNGAFTFFQQGGAIDIDRYISWLEPRLSPPHWCVIPDVIDGTEEEQRALIGAWTLPKSMSAPVWHMGLSIDWLLEIAGNYDRFCFGSSGPFWQVGSEAWARRADEAWNAIERAGLKPWVHMMRGLSLCGDVWPFASADSTNVARNFKNTGDNICPERMARRIDAIQCPPGWNLKGLQTDLFA
jgi:hypothetical protein